MKKLIIVSFLSVIATQSYSLTVYDPVNHKQNMQNYQMMILQKIEEARTATESIIQTQQQLEQLQHDLTNLETWSGALLGEENSALTQALKELNTINQNSKSILRNAETIDGNFEQIYANRDRLSNMSNEELARETYRLSQNRNDNLKEHLKTATTILEQNEKDNQSMAKFMAITDGAKGNLQSNIAAKKGIDQLNNKIARMSELEAKKLIMEAERLAEEEARNRLEDEKAKRLLEMSEQSRAVAEEFKSKQGNGW